LEALPERQVQQTEQVRQMAPAAIPTAEAFLRRQARQAQQVRREHLPL